MEIRLEGIGKTFPSGARALADVNLAVEAGSWLVLVGPSGCGKTTLLRIIAGVETPTTGTVRLDGKEAALLPPWERHVALLPQRPALLPTRTVRDNLAWPWLLRQREPWRTLKAIFGKPSLSPEQEQTLMRTAELLGIAGLLRRRADQLSGGEQQRLALGRLLLRKAGAHLLDEPLAHIDPALRTQLRRQLRLLSRSLLATIIYVTHDPAEALALGEKIAVLAGGALQQMDLPHTILLRPRNRVVAELFGQQLGGLNLIDGDLVEENGRRQFAGPWGLWPLPDDWPSAARQVTLGLRGSGVRLADGGMPMQVVLSELDPAGRWLVCENERGRLTAWLTDGGDVRVGQTVMVAVNLEHALCFDGASGATLRFG